MGGVYHGLGELTRHEPTDLQVVKVLNVVIVVKELN